MSYEQKYEVVVGTVRLPFVRRPVGTEPSDGTIGLIDFGPADRIERQTAGIFAAGEWRTSRNRKLAQQPSHWTECLGPRS